MLELIKGNAWEIIPTDSYSITYKYSGVDELAFDVSIYEPIYAAIEEESKIYETTTSQYFNVKYIDAGQETASITCQISLYDWKYVCLIDYSNGTKTIQDTVSGILPTGWSMQDSTPKTDKKLVEVDGGTKFEILTECADTFGCTFRFDTLNRVIKIIWPDSFADTGKYLIDTGNLSKKPEFKGSSESLVNCIYPFGKDGLDISSVNDGKKYVENYGYSDTPSCYYWSDERYEDAQSLKDAAVAMLEYMSVPDREWSVSISKFSLFKVGMFDVVKVFDSARGINFLAQVQEMVVHPYYPEQDEVTIKRFGNTGITINGNATADVKRKASSAAASANATAAELSKIGTIVESTSRTAVSVPTGAVTNLTSITLDPGVWLLVNTVYFINNSTGERGMCVSETKTGWTVDGCCVTANAVSGDATTLNGFGIRSVSSTTTFYLNGYHTRGSNLNVASYFLHAVRMI